jgi:hypothetical protein
VISSDSIARCCALILAVSACSPSDEEAEKACFDKLSADFESSRLFAREQAAAAPWGSEEAVSWNEYAVVAAQSSLQIAVIHSDDDRNACDYVSDGAYLQRK